MKRKFALIILTALLSLSIISCGNKNTLSQSNSDRVEENTDNESTKETDQSTNKDNTSKKTDSNKDENSSASKNNSDSSKENNSQNSSSSKSENKVLRIFYYDIEKESIVYFDKTVSVTDGAIAKAIINEYKGSLDSPSLSGLPDNISISSAKLEKNKDLLTVNFGGNFINTLGYDSKTEQKILQSIVNSLGYNLGISKVCITVSGKPYSINNQNNVFNVNYN